MSSNQSYDQLLELLPKEIEITSSPDALGDDLFHFQATLGSSGFGTALTRELALIKACSELAERIALNQYFSSSEGLTSNGFGVHRTYSSAVQSATLELLERDALLSCWLTRTSPVWLDTKSVEGSVSPLTTRQIEIFASHGFRLQFGLLALSNNHPSLVAALSYPTKHELGWVITTATASSLDEAIFRCLLDHRRAATVLLQRLTIKSPLFTSLDISELRQPRDHFEYYLNKDKWTENEWFWSSSTAVQSIQIDDFKVEILPNAITLPWEYSTVRLTSSSLQDFYVGVPRMSDLNFHRLAALSKNNLEFNLTPHPLA